MPLPGRAETTTESDASPQLSVAYPASAPIPAIGRIRPNAPRMASHRKSRPPSVQRKMRCTIAAALALARFDDAFEQKGGGKLAKHPVVGASLEIKRQWHGWSSGVVSAAGARKGFGTGR